MLVTSIFSNLIKYAAYIDMKINKHIQILGCATVTLVDMNQTTTLLREAAGYPEMSVHTYQNTW